MDIIGLQPITEVHLLKGVPLDNTYQHTLTFSDKTSQYGYFAGKTKTSFTDLTPVDLNNDMQLPINAYSIYDCNYLMFKNANFSGKWLYAFITNIEYISVNCCKVSFELDLMQTWYFDYTVKKSFVVREHVVDDSIGANIVDEGLDTGEYVRSASEVTGKMDYFNIVMAISYDKDVNPNMGTAITGVYSGLQYRIFNLDLTDAQNGIPALNSVIKTCSDVGKSSMIVSIFMMPTDFITDKHFEPTSYDISPLPRPNTFQGYTPKNNKLYTYPYSFMYVSNNQGSAAVYRYEYMDNKINPQFKLIGDMSPSPSVYLMPIGYKGMTTNAEEKMVLTNFPQCSWNNDVYSNWLAQNSNRLTLSALTNVGTAIAGAVSKDATLFTSGITGIANEMSQILDRSIQPAQACGNIGGASSLAVGLQDFFFYTTTITKNYAERIDNYWELYGYKVNAIKIPEINSRPYWNYVQTMNANLTGSIPFNDISKIKTIYDKGITFWHGDYVGDYTLNNH